MGQARLDGDSETRRADRNRILRELNRLALQTARLSFNELCGFPGGRGRRHPIAHVGRPASARVPHWFCQPRARELHLLKVERLKADRSPYTLISAPAGYGKSRLLLHLVQTLAADEAGEYTRDAGESPVSVRNGVSATWSVPLQPADQAACVVHALAGLAALDRPGQPQTWYVTPSPRTWALFARGSPGSVADVRRRGAAQQCTIT